MSRSLLSQAVGHFFPTISSVVCDLLRLAFFATCPRSALAAENLFLRKQLALFQEREVKPRRADDATRWLMAAVSRLFDWRMAVVKPDTFIRWHRKGSGCSGARNRNLRDDRAYRRTFGS
jgi:hypothetical protein